MAVTLQEQEARREVLSGGPSGAPIVVALDYTAAADVTDVHHIDATDAVDSVWLQAWNTTGADVTLSLVLNPSDDTSTAAIDAATITSVIPAGDEIWLLQGNAFRNVSGNTTSITAYTATADVDKIKLTGYVVRAKGALLY